VFRKDNDPNQNIKNAPVKIMKSSIVSWFTWKNPPQLRITGAGAFL
jgi:hypothetical protein